MNGSDPRDTTVGGVLATASREMPNGLALVEGDVLSARKWTFSELERDARAMAAWLLQRFQPGDRVAIWSANSPEWVIAEFGAALAGLVLVTVNPANQAGELRHVLRQSEAVGILVQRELRGRSLLEVVDAVRADTPALQQVISLDEVRPEGVTATLPTVDPGDIAQIQYTSGTTGFPKGAQLTHRGLTNVARMFADVNKIQPDDVWLNPMPLFHTAGCGLVTLGAVQTGSAQVLPAAFDADLALDLFQAHRATVMLSVPTMLIRILDAQSARPRDLSSWRLTALGGAPIAPELVRRAHEELGLIVTIGFGQTEASPYMTHTLPDDPHPSWQSTVGRPFPGVRLRILDPETDTERPDGEVGEVAVSSVGVMAGYLNDPVASAAVLRADGWLRTGDLGSLDEHGYLNIRGRLRDQIIRGGENIFPREIEDVLHTHPDVADVAVFGVPDPEWGEIVAAFVRLHPGTEPDPDALADYCRAHLAPYKTPRVWRFRDEFPQTASGKIQKFVMREQYLAETEER